MNKILLYTVFSRGMISGLALRTVGAEGTITIEKERHLLSDAKLAETRCTPSVKRGTKSGFLPNRLVVDASSSTFHREGNHSPYYFRFFTPKAVQPQKKYPLLLWLYGAGESQSDNENLLAHMQSSIDLPARPNRPDFFLVAIQCPKETWSREIRDPRTPNRETPFKILDKITKALTKQFPIDKNRINILGICSGAMAGFDLIEKFPGRYSAFAACSPNRPGTKVDAYRRLPIRMFNNRDNLDVRYDNTQLAKTVNCAGGDLYLTIHTSGGHDTWTGAQRDNHVL